MRKSKKQQHTLLVALCIAILFWIGYEAVDSGTDEAAQKSSAEVIDTTDWETYRNDRYGVGFKYPKWIHISEASPVREAVALGEPRGDMYALLTFRIDTTVREHSRRCPSEFSETAGYARLAVTGAHSKGDFSSPLQIEFFPRKTEELGFYHNGYHYSFTVNCPLGISDLERQAMIDSVYYFTPSDTKAIIDLLKAESLFPPGFTSDSSNWSSYKNDRDGIEFKYPSSYGIHPGDNTVEFSLPLVTDAKLLLVVRWTTYHSLDETHSCDDGYSRGPKCEPISYREDVGDILRNVNMPAMRYPASYRYDGSKWYASHVIHISAPNMIVQIEGTVDGATQFLDQEMKSLVKELARTIVVK